MCVSQSTPISLQLREKKNVYRKISGDRKERESLKKPVLFRDAMHDRLEAGCMQNRFMKPTYLKKKVGYPMKNKIQRIKCIFQERDKKRVGFFAFAF